MVVKSAHSSVLTSLSFSCMMTLVPFSLLAPFFHIYLLPYRETCRRSRASEQAKMKQAMQDFRAKSSKSGEASPGTQGSSPAVHHHAPVGGVFVGDKGKEILQEKQHRVSQQSVMPADDSQPKRLV